MSLRLRLLGLPALLGPEGPLTGRVAQRHRLALLALLATAPGRSLSRDKLMAYLWPEAETKRARHLLNVSVYVLRKALPEGALISAGDDLRLDAGAVRIDVAELEEAVEREDLQAAVALYRGPFLDSFHLSGAPEFEKWADTERARLSSLYQRALEELATRAAEAGDARAEVGWWRRLAAEDPYNTRYVLRLMEALEAVGDRGNGIQVAEAHESLLREELDAEPDPELRALARRLREVPNGPSLRPLSRAAPPRVSPGDALVAARGEAGRAGPAAPAAGTQSTGAVDDLRRPGRGPRIVGWALAALAVLTLAGLAALLLLRRDDVLKPDRVVVAPFTNLTGDPALDPLGHMAAEWIAEGLSRSGLVEVIDPLTLRLSAEGTAGEARGAEASALRLARATGAGTLVWGSLSARRDSLEVSARVIGAASGEVLRLVERTVVPRSEPEAALQALRSRVVGALSSLVDPRLASLSLTSSDPPTFEAYREYAKGLDLFATGEFPRALPFLYRAHERDSSFVLALHWAAMAEWNAGTRGYPGGVERSDSLIRHLDARRDRLPPLSIHGVDYVLARDRGDWTLALAALERAAALSPRSNYGLMLARERTRAGHYAEAIALLTGMDPERGWVRDFPGYWGTLADAYHMAGEHERELEAVARAAVLSPREEGSETRRVRGLAALGRSEEIEELIASFRETDANEARAIDLFEAAAIELRAHGHAEHARDIAVRCLEWESARPDPARRGWRLRLLQAKCLYLAGRLEEARPLFASLVAEDQAPALLNPILEYGYLGSIAARLGDVAEARRVLERLADLPRDPRMVGLLPEGADSVHRQRVAYQRARIAAALGNGDEALRLLRQIDAGGMWYNRMDVRRAVHSDLEFEPLRRDPSFRRFLEESEPDRSHAIAGAR